MDILPLKVFTDLATKPIFIYSGWLEPPRVTFGNEFVTADLYCEVCEKEKTFSGKAYSRLDLALQYQKVNSLQYDNFGMMPYDFSNDDVQNLASMIDEMPLEVDDTVTVRLKCPTCGSVKYICYHIDKQHHFNESMMSTELDKILVTKIGEYPSQEANLTHQLIKYKNLFPIEYEFITFAEKSYYGGLGTGAIVYLRKAYESLLFGILDENGIARPENFRQVLEKADRVANIVPVELKDRAYGLFGEMSDLIHGESEDSDSMLKYEHLRDIFKTIMDGMLEKRRLSELAQKIKLDNSPKSRGGGTIK